VIDRFCQGRRNNGREGAAVKELGAMETYKKNALPNMLVLSSNTSDLTNNDRNY